MIATFMVESVLFVYTLLRYRMTTLGRIIAGLLGGLAIFQFAEYNVCGQGLQPASWSRVGYIAIALLPALGLHLVSEIAGRRNKTLVTGGYATSLLFAGAFGLNNAAFQGHVCAGNYAVFQLVSPLGGLFFIYYYLLLFIGIFLAIRYAAESKPTIRRALQLQVAGYLGFILPTGVVNAVNPQTIAGIPSIMCGFAVTYALILVFGIVPLVLARREPGTAGSLTHAH